MSSSAKFKRLVYDAAINDRPIDMLSAYHDWQIANCYHPIKIRAFDAHQQIMRDMYVACGRCAHCYETKIHEWCTRMYAHAEDFKHVYFVTLTYAPIYNKDFPYNSLIMNKLSSAVWHYDNFNATKRFCYNPCLLVKSHYQNFLKRLRKNTGLNDISYVLSGEYGSKYGRPHFHIVLFTNGILTKKDILLAWSIRLWRYNDGRYVYYRNQSLNGQEMIYTIGRVDFNDLVSNGTFNTTSRIRVDGSYISAGNCFAYVCKYVSKRNDPNLDRVNLAYNSLYHKETFTKVFDNDIQLSIVKQYLLEHGYPLLGIDTAVESVKKYSYEKTIYDPKKSVFTDGLQQFKKQNVFGTVVDLQFYPEVYYEFRDFFRPFCEFSRGCPIGSVYANRHLQEFTEGVFNSPILQDRSFVVPSYFRRKAQYEQFGLRKCRKSLKSTSFVMGGLIDLYRRFMCASEGASLSLEYFVPSADCPDFKSALHKDRYLFKDLSTGERIILSDNKANFFKYSRKDRTYFSTRSVPLADWLRFWCDKLRFEFVDHLNKLNESERNLLLRSDAIDLMQEFHGKFTDIRDRFIENQQYNYTKNQDIYNSLHMSVE